MHGRQLLDLRWRAEPARNDLAAPGVQVLPKRGENRRILHARSDRELLELLFPESAPPKFACRKVRVRFEESVTNF